MKTRYTAIAAYEAPQCRVIEINIQNLVCTSPTGRSNEPYEDGDTSGWYND